MPNSKRSEPGRKHSKPGSKRSKPGSKRGRMHDAEGTREAILNAAEEVFAEHGFDGARIDAIAAAAGYNKSLIFQYFGDKLGLYAAVVRRADEQTRVLQNRAFMELGGENLALNPEQIRELLRDYTGWYFDYLVEHPQVMRIFNWELAEGWQTFSKILTQRDYDDVDQFMPIFSKLQNAGLMRSKLNPLVQFTPAIFMCNVYLAILPMYKILMPGENFISEAALADAREYVVDFVVNGLLISPMAAKS
jgi:TetR/AcrR family transcriptional regulator